MWHWWPPHRLHDFLDESDLSFPPQSRAGCKCCYTLAYCGKADVSPFLGLATSMSSDASVRRGATRSGLAYVRKWLKTSQTQFSSGVLYIVGSRAVPKWAIFACPCGCGDRIELYLGPRAKPRWRASFNRHRTTLTPSVAKLADVARVSSCAMVA